MSTKKYVSLDKLSIFLNKLKTIFAAKDHTHAVDSALSDTSINPVQNKVLNAEFDAIADGIGALELAIDSKADKNHNHNAEFEVIVNAFRDLEEVVDGKALKNHDHDGRYDTYGSAASAYSNASAQISEVAEGFSTVIMGMYSDSLEEGAEELPTIKTVASSVVDEHASRKDNPHGVTTTQIGAVPTSRKVNNKALSADITLTASDVSAVPTTRTVNSKALSSNITLTASDVGADASGSASAALEAANKYTDAAAKQVKDDLLNGAGTAYDTLKELGELIDNNQDAISALETVAAGKADADHDHAIADVSGLQDALNGKANTSHGAHVPTPETANNAKFLRNDNTWQTVTPANIGAVPTTRTVNSKALSSDITLAASDVGAVPTSRKVNNKALSADITLTASDVSAVPTTRTVNSKALSSNITLTASDVGADASGSAAGALKDSKAYADGLIAALDVTDTAVTGKYVSAVSETDGKISVTRASLPDYSNTYAPKSHGHAIADVSGLQDALDGKAASSHGTHVSYSTTAPVMDGTASVGTASTVARSDHKHPTDTTRAAASDLTSHTGNTTVHITSTERTNWNEAYTHSQAAHAPSNAEKNQNAFSNVTVGSTTIAADTTTDTLTLVAGSNVTLTPDATNDKITIASSHPSVSTSTDTTSTASPTHGETFTAVDSVTRDSNGHVTKVNTKTVTIPSDRLFTTLVPTGTAIPASANLNTTTYLKVGRYYCAKNADATTLTNSPLSIAFMMEVYSPLSTTIDNETNKTWVYRLRKMTAYNTGVQYIQYCYAGATANSWSYGDWYVVPRSKFTLDSNDANGGVATLGSSTKPVYVASDGTLTECSYTLGKSVPSDAVFTDTVYKVEISATQPSSPCLWFKTTS